MRAVRPLPLVLAALLLGSVLTACGESPAMHDAGVASASQCYYWQGPVQWGHRWGGEFRKEVGVVLHADGRYGSCETHPPGPSAIGPMYDCGRWAAKDGKITFCPDSVRIKPRRRSSQ